MRASSKILALILTLVMALAVMPLMGCSSTQEDSGGGDEEASTEATGEPYRIGAVLSLSGPYAGLGEPEKNAIEMEVEAINAAGGINGRPIEVIIEDDATDEAQSVSATTKLIEQDEVLAIMGATGTGQSMAMRGDINRAMIPQVSLGGGTVITGEFDPLVFQTPWSNTLVVPFLWSYLQDQGVTKVALISDSGGFGKDGVAVIEGATADYGIEIVANETFNPGDTDMSAQLTKIKGTDAEALVMWSAGAEAATVLQNADQLQLGMPIYGSHGNARMELIDGAGEAAEGFIFPAGKILLPEAYGEGTEGYDVATDFIDRYTEEFGEAPNTFAGHAYDAIHIIAEAMMTLDEDFTPEELRDAIEGTSGLVAIGGTFTFSPDDHNGLTESDLVLYEVSGGEWVLVE
jgi:branched-chain amino acid transport system substrate-binding protein